MCGKQAAAGCCRGRGAGPRRKAAAPASLCWVCGGRTSGGGEAPAVPPPRPPFPAPIDTPFPLSLSAESPGRQGAVSEHTARTGALNTFQALKVFARGWVWGGEETNFQSGERPTRTTEGARQVKASTGAPCPPPPLCRFAREGKAFPEWPVTCGGVTARQGWGPGKVTCAP